MATLGAVYKHQVIQVSRLSQVLAHRDKFRSKVLLFLPTASMWAVAATTPWPTRRLSRRRAPSLVWRRRRASASRCSTSAGASQGSQEPNCPLRRCAFNLYRFNVYSMGVVCLWRMIFDLFNYSIYFHFYFVHFYRSYVHFYRSYVHFYRSCERTQ